MSYDRVEALKDAVEGECDGLVLSDDQAQNILDYIDSAQAEIEPAAWRDFLKNLIERCEHGDINAECDDPDWRDIYVKAQAMLATPATAAEAQAVGSQQ